ncbi:MAG TPA: Uma2 family endonuclease [Kofleriaceae bacterium]
MVIHQSLLSADKIRPLLRTEFERMVELGLFDEDERIELLDGVLVKKMSPQEPPHAEVIEWLSDALAQSVARAFIVRTQMPFAAGKYALPEPDIAVVRRNRRRGAHPHEAVLLVEVANEPARSDRTTKLDIYARAKVPEYWLVDVKKQCIEVYSKLVRGRYTRKRVLRDGDVLRPTLLRGVAIPVSDWPR